MSMAVNYQDVMRQLEIEGLDISNFQIGTSRPMRCKVDGMRGRPGWFWLHEMPFDNGDVVIVGSYGVWHGADNGAMKIALPQGAKASKEDNALIRKRIADNKKRMDAELKASQGKAAKEALKKWNALSDDGESGYLSKKQVRASGVRFTKDGAMAVPMRDTAGKLHGLQFILDKSNPAHKEKIERMEGDKRFWPTGLAMQGHFHTIGKLDPRGVNIITEGYATGDTLNDASGLGVAVCYSANNVLPVLEALKKYYPKAKFLIAADDDYLCRCKECKKQTLVADGVCAHCGKEHGKQNTGVTVAMKACMSVDAAQWIKPLFVDRGGKKLSDFNDLMVLEGLQVVADQVKLAIDAQFHQLGSAAQPQVPRGTVTGGAGNKHRLPTFITVDDAVERFVQVFDVRDTMFDRYLSCLLPKSSMLDIMPDHGWREMKTHDGRQLVLMDQVGFDPTESDANIKCNMWGGWPTKPSTQGSCEKLLGLLEYICSDEDKPREVYKWVLRWLAYPIQNPGAKLKTALVIHGGQGVGKNLFFEAVMKIYGEYGRVVGQADIEDKFNDWVSRKLFLIANEVVARQELFHQKNKLKALITDDTIRINPKNVAAHYESNHMNMVFLSNEAQPVVLDADDRRYMAIWTPKKREKSFYGDVMAEINDGGVAALHQYLLDLDLGDFDNGALPLDTRARKALIEVSKESPDRFIEAWIDDELEQSCRACSLSDLYRVYERWCRIEGERFSYAKNKFSARIAIHDGLEIAKKPVLTTAGKIKVMRVALPDEDPKPDGETWQKWLGERVPEFTRAIEPEGDM